jgi:hypothetical protein
MPRIRCHYIDCIFLDDGYCGAAAVEIDPDQGCMTFKHAGEPDVAEEWDEEEEELDEWDEMDADEESDDGWLDEDEEY